MKREIILSEEESAMLLELLAQDQDRLNAAIRQTRNDQGDRPLRQRLAVTQKVVDAMSREPGQRVLWEELLAWSLPA
jgi:hypothetical protein